MTFLNIVSAVVFVGVVLLLIKAYRSITKEVDEADGLGDINEQGELGTHSDGEILTL